MDNILEKMMKIIIENVEAKSVNFIIEKDGSLNIEAQIESEKNDSTIFENGSNEIIIQDGLVKFTNQGFTEISGYIPEEMIGRPFVDFITPDCRKFLDCTFEKTGHYCDNRLTMSLLLKDGRDIPVELITRDIEYEKKPATMVLIRNIAGCTLSEKQMINSLFSIDPSTVHDGKLTIPEKETKEAFRFRKESIPADQFDILKYIYHQNLSGVKPNYTNIGEVLKLTRPTVRKKIKLLIQAGYLQEDAKGRAKFVELTEKGRTIRF